METDKTSAEGLLLPIKLTIPDANQNTLFRNNYKPHQTNI